MRLLKRSPSGGFELVSLSDDDPPPYAILSHTWTEGEVTYNELVAGAGKDKTGYGKIRFCGDQAAADGLEYFWVDTCCIDKSISQELSTAINSMFRWYQRASKCYVYLSDVSVPDEISNPEAFQIAWHEAFQKSRWFTRGWTLQELVAPTSVEFFCKQGKRLGSRVSLEWKIYEITGIPITALRGQSLTEFSVDERMSWAVKRTTTIKEDKVYCLLGIFSVFLPLIYGEGEVYATQRLRDEIEKRQKGRATDSPRSLPAFSSLPFVKNELFVGRTDELRYLEEHLLVSNNHRRLTIYGLGGCGKSALAIEFAYCALAKHARLVFWVPAISQETFELAYRDIGVRLRISGISDDNADVKKLVREALSSKSMDDWLMIIDNADDHEVLLGTTEGHSKLFRLNDYLPRSARGAILFTTRSRKVAGALTPSSVLGLNDMSRAVAKQLLTRRISNQVLLDDETAVGELLDILTCLPLAIVQAAAFINNNDVSVSGYVSLFRHTDAKTELFNEPFHDPSRYEELDSTVAKTWHISFDQIRKQDPLAAEYLSFMACIDRVNVPQSLLPPGATMVQQIKALGTLTGYAFISERPQPGQDSDTNRYFDMHRLVHMASVCWLDTHDERAAWVNAAVARLQELVPFGGHENKEVWTKYLPHAVHVAGIHGLVDKSARASLLERIGYCQASLGQYSAAGAMHQQVLSVRKDVLGDEHPDTLTSMNEVGSALRGQGKYVEAEEMHRKKLVLSKKVLGDEHPGTLTSMNNLGLALSRQGKYAVAEEVYRETLRLRTKVSGDEHPDTLTSINNLGLALIYQGKYAEAEKMHHEILRLRKKVLGDEHPDTLISMNNLGSALDSQGKYAEAEEMHREALRLRTKVLGDEHPEMLTSMNNLGSALDSQGKYAEAEEMHREALRLRKKVLGDEHPDTLASFYNVARVLEFQEKYVEADEFYREERRARKKGREALRLMTKVREALRWRTEVFGSKHPQTLNSMFKDTAPLILPDEGDDPSHKRSLGKSQGTAVVLQQETILQDPVFALSLPLLVEKILRHLPLPIVEPTVSAGNVRVYWIAGGKRMFDDYTELDSGAAVELEKALQTRYTPSKQAGAGGQPMSGFVQRILDVFRQQAGGQQQPHSDAEQGGHELQTRSDSPASIDNAAASEREDENPRQEALRLLLCVDDGRAKTTLKQEVLHNIHDDRELFTHLRKQYFTKRSWFALRSIGALNLAQFDVNYSNATNVYRHEHVCRTTTDEHLDRALGFYCLCIPPEEKVGDDKEYLCNPAPKSRNRRLVPVLGPTMLKGDFLNPQFIAAGQRTTLNQLPKRRLHVELKATPDDLATGWGLHIEEDWHWPTIYFCFLVLILFSLGFGIGWAAKRNDIQGAFAISGFALTTGAMFLGYMAIPKT